MKTGQYVRLKDTSFMSAPVGAIARIIGDTNLASFNTVQLEWITPTSQQNGQYEKRRFEIVVDRGEILEAEIAALKAKKTAIQNSVFFKHDSVSHAGETYIIQAARPDLQRYWIAKEDGSDQKIVLNTELEAL